MGGSERDGGSEEPSAGAADAVPSAGPEAEEPPTDRRLPWAPPNRIELTARFARGADPST